jgi:hypothetical protein
MKKEILFSQEVTSVEQCHWLNSHTDYDSILWRNNRITLKWNNPNGKGVHQKASNGTETMQYEMASIIMDETKPLKKYSWTSFGNLSRGEPSDDNHISFFIEVFSHKLMF